MKEFKNLRKQLADDAPDLAQQISERADWSAIAADSKIVTDEQIAAIAARKAKAAEQKAANDKKSFGARWGRCAIAACALLVAVILPVSLSLGKKPQTASALYDVVIDVNPNLMLSVGDGDLVTAQRGLNEDGVIFLYNKNYVGQPLERATEDIFSELKRMGIIVVGGTVRISAFDHNTREIKDDVQSLIERKIDGFLGGDVTTLFLSDYELDKIEDYYESHSVKANEATLLNKLKDCIIELAAKKADELGALIGALERRIGGEAFGESEIKQFEDFAKKYKYEFDFDLYGEPSLDEIRDVIDDLEDMRDDIFDKIDDINEADGSDYGELSEDIVELAKESLFGNED